MKLHNLLKLLIFFISIVTVRCSSVLYKMQYHDFLVLRNAAIEDQNLAKKLIDKKKDILESRNSTGETPLIFWAVENNISAVDFLLKNGADINARDHQGESALKHASSLQLIEMTKFLLENGADPNLIDYKGESPLHGAALGCNDSVIQILINNGSKVNVESKYHEFPLHYAAENCSLISPIKMLLFNGAKIEAKRLFGETPLFVAVYYNHYDIASFLIDNGADINIRDSQNKSLLDIAELKGYSRIRELLINKGKSSFK